MSYDVIKNYVKGRMEGLGYIESKSPFNFDDAPETEYDKSFIVAPLAGTIDPDGANLNISIFDSQTWQISLAFAKSSLSDIIKRDDMYRSIEGIITDLDDPDNYSPTVTFIEYESWEVEETSNYFLLNIRLRIQDQYTF